MVLQLMQMVLFLHGILAIVLDQRENEDSEGERGQGGGGSESDGALGCDDFIEVGVRDA